MPLLLLPLPPPPLHNHSFNKEIYMRDDDFVGVFVGAFLWGMCMGIYFNVGVYVEVFQIIWEMIHESCMMWCAAFESIHNTFLRLDMLFGDFKIEEEGVCTAFQPLPTEVFMIHGVLVLMCMGNIWFIHYIHERPSHWNFCFYVYLYDHIHPKVTYTKLAHSVQQFTMMFLVCEIGVAVYWCTFGMSCFLLLIFVVIEFHMVHEFVLHEMDYRVFAGAAEKILRCVNSFDYTSVDMEKYKDVECPICFETTKDDTTLYIQECGHRIHVACNEDYRKGKGGGATYKCPYCVSQKRGEVFSKGETGKWVCAKGEARTLSVYRKRGETLNIYYRSEVTFYIQNENIHVSCPMDEEVMEILEGVRLRMLGLEVY